MKLFSPEELLFENRPPSEMALDALANGHIHHLRFLLGSMSVGHFELCYGYIHWMARVGGKILRDLGEPFFADASARIARFLMAPYAQDLREGKEKQVISDIVSLWCYQMGPVGFQGETDHEVSFLFSPCGSGGRLLLESQYELSPDIYSRLSNGRPVVCRICEDLQHALNQEAGRTFWSVVPDNSRMGHCRASFIKQCGKKERFFSPVERADIVSTRCRQALNRLNHGSVDIKDLLKDQHKEWRPLHDLLCLWITAMFSLAYKEKGIEYLSELVWETYVDMFDGSYRSYLMVDDKSLLRNLIRVWYYHQATFQVIEEDDRFVFRLDPCGSGGRMYRGEMGRTDAFRYGHELLCEIPEKADITFQRAPFPMYCIHCAATNRDQLEGKPWSFLIDGNALCDPSAPCEQYMYKKNAPRIVPPGLAAQVGLADAKPLQKEYIL